MKSKFLQFSEKIQPMIEPHRGMSRSQAIGRSNVYKLAITAFRKSAELKDQTKAVQDQFVSFLFNKYYTNAKCVCKFKKGYKKLIEQQWSEFYRRGYLVNTRRGSQGIYILNWTPHAAPAKQFSIVYWG